MTSEISVAGVPSTKTVFSHLAEKTDTRKIAAALRPKTKLDAQAKIVMDLQGVNLPLLLADSLKVLREFGSSGWQNATGNSLEYGGLSLTYNPDHRDGLDPRYSSLGTPKNQVDDFSDRPKGNYGELKNSYFDTYGFRIRSKASFTGQIGKFIDSVPLTLIRSRIAALPGANVNVDDPNFVAKGTWHRDEPVYQNLRINVPLQTDLSFVFETEGLEPYHLPVGQAYTWDTSQLHRVYCRSRTRTVRIHLVLGFAPWFSYLPETDAWTPNEFFGRIHPFDMIAEGCFGPSIRLVATT